IGTPFPANPVRAAGVNNTYVALVYKHGQPIVGKAWNEMGSVQCAFAYQSKCFKGSEVQGQIQILQYEGHATTNFFYDWIKYEEWAKAQTSTERLLVRCGASTPILWAERALLGTFYLDTRQAVFGTHDGDVVQVADDHVLKHMRVLVRNYKDRPPYCDCAKCLDIPNATEEPRVMINEWADYNIGSSNEKLKPVRALDRQLKTPRGLQDHYVGLWYRHGRPVMGRAWKVKSGFEASFTHEGKEFTGIGLGTLQLLLQLPPAAAGFDYSWQPFFVAAKCGPKEFHPVHIDFVAPCVLFIDGKFEILGTANLKLESAEASFEGRTWRFEGRAVRDFLVLCRKDRDDTMAI
ncbi:P40 protein, partial [Aphelenchoides avenae]